MLRRPLCGDFLWISFFVSESVVWFSSLFRGFMWIFCLFDFPRWFGGLDFFLFFWMLLSEVGVYVKAVCLFVWGLLERRRRGFGRIDILCTTSFHYQTMDICLDV
jgi:hypothetical protein